MDAHGLVPTQRVSAARKLGHDEARSILAASSRLIVAKGRRRDDFDTGGAVDEEVLGRMLGPTGNLRAPCVRTGDTTLVGFDDEAWETVLLLSAP